MDSPFKKQEIKITEVRVDTDPPTTVYQLEILTDMGTGKSSWDETFNTKEQLNAFLRGLRVATSMLGNTFNMDCWVFDKDSVVDSLP